MLIGRIDPAHPELTVVGGGIAGLLVAHSYLKRGFRVRLLERGPRLGGMLETIRTPFGPAERAAHSFLVTPPVASLCSELGVELIPAREKARYILRDGRPRRFPLGVGEALGTARKALFARPVVAPDATLADWARAHLGDAALDWMLDPFTHGIYGVSPADLSLDLAFPKLRARAGQSLLGHMLERRRAKAPRPLFLAPRLGMGTLAQALAGAVLRHPGCTVELGADVPELPSGQIVLCAPTRDCARLLSARAPSLARMLDGIPYTALTTATAFVRKKDLTDPRDGVGVLFPSREGMAPALGVLFNSSAFEDRVADPELASFTVILSGAPEDLHGKVRHALSAAQGLRGEPVHVETFSWPRAIPLYDRRLVATLEQARAELPDGLAIFGNFTGAVSLRGMIEAITSPA